jgi:hypothetical protein
MDVGIVIRPGQLFTALPISTQTKRVHGIGLFPRILDSATVIDTGLGIGKLGTVFKAYRGFGMVGVVIVHVRVVVVECPKVGKHVGYGGPVNDVRIEKGFHFIYCIVYNKNIHVAEF